MHPTRPLTRASIRRKRQRSIFASTLVLLLLATATFSAPRTADAASSSANSCPAANAFTDVPANGWYADPVAWAACNGITSGTSATTFSPNAKVTRGQLATFLWRMMGEPEPETSNSFIDVNSSHYFDKPVSWMLEEEITSRASKFNPSWPVQRANLATFVWRMMGQPATSNVMPFTDVSNSHYYSKPVRWLGHTGISNGTKFFPTRHATRAEVVTFLYRLDQQSCMGEMAEVMAPGTRQSDAQVVRGTDGADNFRVGSQQKFCAGAGNDTITVNGSGGEIYAGSGNDTINGSSWGDITIYGGPGRDRIRMSASNSNSITAYGGDDGDWLYGTGARDTLHGGDGNDYILGGNGADTIDGGAGADYISGQAGQDTIDGGEGNDTIFGNLDADTINGGPGSDRITGGGKGDTINGGPGNDTIFGDGETGASSDVRDLIRGDAGNDTITGGNGYDDIDGGTGANTCTDSEARNCTSVGTDTAAPSAVAFSVVPQPDRLEVKWQPASDNVAVVAYDLFVNVQGQPKGSWLKKTFSHDADPFFAMTGLYDRTEFFEFVLVARDEQGNTSRERVLRQKTGTGRQVVSTSNPEPLQCVDEPNHPECLDVPTWADNATITLTRTSQFHLRIQWDGINPLSRVETFEVSIDSAESTNENWFIKELGNDWSDYEVTMLANIPVGKPVTVSVTMKDSNGQKSEPLEAETFTPNWNQEEHQPPHALGSGAVHGPPAIGWIATTSHHVIGISAALSGDGFYEPAVYTSTAPEQSSFFQKALYTGNSPFGTRLIGAQPHLSFDPGKDLLYDPAIGIRFMDQAGTILDSPVSTVVCTDLEERALWIVEGTPTDLRGRGGQGKDRICRSLLGVEEFGQGANWVVKWEGVRRPINAYTGENKDYGNTIVTAAGDIFEGCEEPTLRTDGKTPTVRCDYKVIGGYSVNFGNDGNYSLGYISDVVQCGEIPVRIQVFVAQHRATLPNGFDPCSDIGGPPTEAELAITMARIVDDSPQLAHLLLKEAFDEEYRQVELYCQRNYGACHYQNYLTPLSDASEEQWQLFHDLGGCNGDPAQGTAPLPPGISLSCNSFSWEVVLTTAIGAFLCAVAPITGVAAIGCATAAGILTQIVTNLTTGKHWHEGLVKAAAVSGLKKTGMESLGRGFARIAASKAIRAAG